VTTIKLPEVTSLTAELREWFTVKDGAEGHVYVILEFGSYELARWDVTEHRAEFEAQPGDYWDEDTREQHERSWVSGFVGPKLQSMWRLYATE